MMSLESVNMPALHLYHPVHPFRNNWLDVFTEDIHHFTSMIIFNFPFI